MLIDSNKELIDSYKNLAPSTDGAKFKSPLLKEKKKALSSFWIEVMMSLNDKFGESEYFDKYR